MYKSYFRGIPWKRFMEFIAPAADRFTILKKLLDEAMLEYTTLEIAGNRHFIVAPPPPEEKFLRRPPVILVAHYDRTKNSPGANDNSAGVFILLETAMKLMSSEINNWLVIFTDKEELEAGESITAQGSYALAVGLKNLKMENTKIYIFDACGIGDTLLISTTVEYLLKKDGNEEKLPEPLLELRNFALDTARNLGMKKVLLVPTPFSDDVGFLRAGLAAQTITMLPSEECIRLVSELRKTPDFHNALINSESKLRSRSISFPDTWRLINTPRDSYLHLTTQHFRTVVRFAEALCRD